MENGKSKIKHACVRHPDRLAAVDKNGYQCWECYLGKARFRQRFPADFYKATEDTEPQRKKNKPRMNTD